MARPTSAPANPQNQTQLPAQNQAQQLPAQVMVQGSPIDSAELPTVSQAARKGGLSGEDQLAVAGGSLIGAALGAFMGMSSPLATEGRVNIREGLIGGAALGSIIGGIWTWWKVRSTPPLSDHQRLRQQAIKRANK